MDKKIPFTTKNEKGEDVHYALGFNTNGTVELFRWRNVKDGALTNPYTGKPGAWSWTKTYVDTAHAARRLLALGMGGVYASTVDDFVLATQTAADRIADCVLPDGAGRTHAAIYTEDLDYLRVISDQTGEPIIRLLSKAIRHYIAEVA